MRIFIILLLTLNTNIQAQTKDELVDEDRIENVWTVSYYSFENYDDKQTYVVASVNGKISHGDRFSIMIPTQKAEYCDYGKSMTTFYTTAGNKNINKLQNKIIPAVFKNENINIEIENTSKFLMGDRVFINMGINSLNNIKNFFQNKNLVSLQLLDEQDLQSLSSKHLELLTLILIPEPVQTSNPHQLLTDNIRTLPMLHPDHYH